MDMEIHTVDMFDQLDRETCFMSSPHQMMGTPSAKAIIAMGRPVLPHILRALEKHECVWPLFQILHKILGKGPTIPEKQRGKVDYVLQEWIALLKKELAMGDAPSRLQQYRIGTGDSGGAYVAPDNAGGWIKASDLAVHAKDTAIESNDICDYCVKSMWEYAWCTKNSETCKFKGRKLMSSEGV